MSKRSLAIVMLAICLFGFGYFTGVRSVPKYHYSTIGAYRYKVVLRTNVRTDEVDRLEGDGWHVVSKGAN